MKTTVYAVKKGVSAVVDRLDPFWLHRGREMAPLIDGRSVANLLHHPG